MCVYCSNKSRNSIAVLAKKYAIFHKIYASNTLLNKIL